MVFLEKSQPAPTCLASEKAKKNGDYKCQEVLERLQVDFKDKCYLCEDKPMAINVEHFVPHRGDIDLKFDWDNLFWSCAHCNNTKLDNYTNILNCTKVSDYVSQILRYIFKPFPKEKVRIEALDSNPQTLETQQLLDAVYNGSTALKRIESSRLRDRLLKEIRDFQKYLCDYFEDTNTEEDRQYMLRKIRGHLHVGSCFSAFKRWIIWENEALWEEFGAYID
jgi:hypothetical protein